MKKGQNKSGEMENFKVVLLGIIFNPEKRMILIGKREKDIYLPKLSWVFPGGKASYNEDLDKSLKKVIEEQTGLTVKNLGAVFAKTYPEKKDMLSIYFLCEAIRGKEKAGGKLVNIKWVKPEDIQRHFTTSFHPRLKEYIMNLR